MVVAVMITNPSRSHGKAEQTHLQPLRRPTENGIAEETDFSYAPPSLKASS